MIKQSGAGSKRIKAQIKGPSGGTYNYDIPTTGSYQTIPLQMGSGTYQVSVLKQVSGQQYSYLINKKISVSLSSPSINFLYPSQFVNYNSGSQALRKGYGLCMNAKSDLEKVRSVYNWIVTNISYDYNKAASVSSGYIPNVDKTLSSKKGICFDYAALMAAMLRPQGIPTKMIFGYSGGVYHAWNQVYISGVGWIAVGIKSNGGWKLLDTTFAASGTDAGYLSNSGNYSGQKVY